ncbi:MAG: Rubredoxin, partial [uncultured Solirubrobacteraceae bacterium]
CRLPPPRSGSASPAASSTTPRTAIRTAASPPARR